MSAADAVRRSQIAALAADESWAQTPDWTSRTAAARAARWKGYESQVDPERQLDARTRAKKAEKAFQADQRRNSRKGVLARRRNTCDRLSGSYVEIVTETGETLRGTLTPLNSQGEIRLEYTDGSQSDPMPISRVANIRAAKQRRGAAA